MEKKIHFITYGNGNFEKAKKRIIKEAENTKWFHSIKGYGMADLPLAFKNKYHRIIYPRQEDIDADSKYAAAQYYIWKPCIISRKLSEMNEGEYLVYCDAGCTINKNGEKRFYEYIDLLSKSDFGIITFGRGAGSPERTWTTKEIFEFFSVDINSNIAKSPSYQACLLIMKKNQHALTIINKWMDTLDKDRNLFTNYYKNQENYFKDYRHDQSILSVICKLEGSIEIDKNETWGKPFEIKCKNYPFWATRKNNSAATAMAAWAEGDARRHGGGGSTSQSRRRIRNLFKSLYLKNTLFQK